MKRFLCEFMGHYLGGFAIVDAETEDEARSKLLAALPEGLARENRDRASIRVGPLNVPPVGVLVIWDGNY